MIRPSHQPAPPGLVFALGAMLAFVFHLEPTVPAQVPQAAAAAGGGSHEVLLDYEETPYPVLHSWRGELSAPAAVTKTPDFGRRRAFVRMLPFGAGTNHAVACAWDPARGRLHLDLNWNGDLTDDPAGVFTAPNLNDFQTFTNVQGTLHTSLGRQPLLADLFLYHFESASHPQLQVMLRCFWQGKLTLAGQEWQVGVIGLPGSTHGFGEPGSLLLRPWTERSNRLDLIRGTPDAVPFAPRLFWLGRAYDLSCSFFSQEGKPHGRLQFKEVPADWVDLQVAGQFLHRLVLQRPREFTVVLDGGPSPAKVPRGTAQVSQVWIKSGTNLAVASTFAPVQIDLTNGTTLTRGGPLTNAVTLTRRGRNLVLDYRLAGAGGDAYRLLPDDQTRPPEFVISRGGKVVRSGQFEFG